VSKHTPGPWWKSDNGSEIRPTAIHASGAANIIVATTWSLVPPDEEKANADLLVAAPTLLEAAKDAVSMLEQVERPDKYVYASIEALQSAIDQAKGVDS
jgi:hypothetical protein